MTQIVPAHSVTERAAIPEWDGPIAETIATLHERGLTFEFGCATGVSHHHDITDRGRLALRLHVATTEDAWENG